MICLLPIGIAAQQYFPVKVNNQWGLMDSNGDLFIEPIYNAIGEFKQFGYAVMQRNGGVGLLNKQGNEIIQPQYDDLKVLDSTLVAVMDNREWMVINLQGTVVLNKGYQRVHVWNSQFLAFIKDNKWGLVDVESGKIIADPTYDQIDLLKDAYFQTQKEDQIGLLASNGKTILEPLYEQVFIYNESLFFYKKNGKWGAVDAQGQSLIEPLFPSYQRISDQFIKLQQSKRCFLYSIPVQKIITGDEFQNFYNFGNGIALSKNNRQLGLIDTTGFIVLPNEFDEIHVYNQDLYRVSQNDLWGLVSKGGKVVMPFQYDYIAPLNNQVCVVKKNDFFGIANFKGEEVVATEFSRIELNDNQAKAFKNEALSMFHFDEDGQLKDQNQFKKHMTIRIGKRNQRVIRRTGWNLDRDLMQLEKFEWFYSRRADKWGLRRLADGEVQIKPTYDWIQIERDKGFTLVGIEKQSYFSLDRTDFRFEMVYGIVNNDVGMLSTMVNLWDIRMSDFDDGYNVARCLFSNGRHGLISKLGKVIIKDYAYIGDFYDGVARMSVKGKLSGKIKAGKYGIQTIQSYFGNIMAPSRMTDYTKYDLQFNREAEITCEKCNWGYIDTSGTVVVPPNYSFARDFVNEIGIVELDKKWGVVNKKATVLVPCNYDNVDFLENTDEKIIRISLHQQKYGLIDSLGQITVSSSYDKIGDFSENRLAVMLNNKWGFVNKNGVEIIPCIYNKINNFHEGYATVKKGSKWGIINKNGDTIIEFEHNHLGNVRDGLVWFHAMQGKGYMDVQQNIKIEPIYQRIHDFEDGKARVKLDGKWGIIDTNGKYVLKPKYDNISSFDANGLAVIQYGSDRIKYGLINTEGVLLTSKGYKKIEPFKEGRAVVLYKGDYGFIDTKGRLVVPTVYSKASSFSEGRAAVQKDGICGYIDSQGNIIGRFEYSKCLDFSEGKAIVYKGLRKAGLIDLKGNYIIEPSLNRLLDFNDGRGLVRDSKYRFYYITEQARLYEGYYQNATEFKNGVAVVQIDGKWGVINQKGIEIVPPKYDKISEFDDGYAKVRIARLSGLTNLDGELIVQPDYEYISYAGAGLFRVEQGDKIGYFDTKGTWIWNLQK